MARDNNEARQRQLQLQLLKLIPSSGKIDVGTLVKKLRSVGFVLPEGRSGQQVVRRELDAMVEAKWPLKRYVASRPYGWRWQKGAAPKLLGMDSILAMSFSISGEVLKPLLPESILSHLKPYFQQAREELNRLPGAEVKKTKRWWDKIYHLPVGQPLIPPAVSLKKLETVYTALFDDKCLKMTYTRRSREPGNQRYVLSPLGLVSRGGILYLIGAKEDHQVRKFALHRIVGLEVLKKNAFVPEGFSLCGYISTQHDFDLPLSKKQIQLVALFDEHPIRHLQESLLSKDQTIEEQPDGRYKVTASVADTEQLRWWLQGYGGRVEVLEPKGLREEIAKSIQKAAGYYQNQ